MLRPILLWGISICLAGSSAFAQSVTMESLLDEMVNRDVIARYPSPMYTCRQASSYDRDSVAPDKPGWFANWDRSQFVRVEERQGHKEYVLMDVDGPGAVVRFWATWHGPGGGEFTNGTLRVFLDQDPRPAIEGPISEVLDGGKLVGPPLSEGVSPETEYRYRGHNLYLPIPYANHCKITYETAAPVDQGAKTGEALYYQINYRTYPQETRVESFDLTRLRQLKSKIAEVQARLLQSGWETAKSLPATSFSGTIARGKSRSVDLDGPAAVRHVSLRLEAQDLPQALQSTVLEIEFDGKSSVWCPVGNLVGIGYEPRPCRTWYTEVTSDGELNCYWVMPFAKTCRLTVHNLGNQDVVLSQADVRLGDWKWDDRSMHFHAAWKPLTKVETRSGIEMNGGGAFDVNYVEVEGAGVYVGDTLTVFNGADAWWGEGDEKIFVDGEAFPSHIGTGTEDYYGYAWCRPEFFSSPFHAQPCGDGNVKAGFSANSRYRALDAIPFSRSIKFDMELWHWAGTQINYAPATFWYARPGATCNIDPATEAAQAPIARKREDVVEVFRVENALEGEDLKVVNVTGGTHSIQDGPDYRWSGDRQLWWIDGKAGDRLVLEFPVEKAGHYQLFANLTKANDYGIVRLSVNGQDPREFDRYHPVVNHDKLDLGKFDLTPGTHQLLVEIVGANDAAAPRHMFGLDYLQLVPGQ